MSILKYVVSDWKFFISSASFLALFISLIFRNSILSMGGLSLVLVFVFICFMSMCATFVGLYKLLQHKEPIPLTFFHNYFQYFGLLKLQSETKTLLKPNAESVKRLTLDIDKYFISKWYGDISKDTNFSDESKAFLEEVLTRLVDVHLQVDYKHVLHGILNIYLKHLKEFRRSLKRKEKYNGAIEDLYRYSHICSTSNTKKPVNFFLHQLTINLLRHFINSELWNTLPCHILLSILARKLMHYLLNMLSNPEVINYLILTSFCSDSVREKYKLSDYGCIALVQFFDVVEEAKNKDSEEVQKPVEETTNKKDSCSDSVEYQAKLLQEKVEAASREYKRLDATKAKLKEQKILGDKVALRSQKQHVEVDNSVEKSPKRSDPVKIYEPKSTSRTWRDSRDLACISLGQDPLDPLSTVPADNEGKNVLKHGFWETPTKSADNKQDSPPTAAHIFNEMMHMTSMEGLKSSIKPISDATERTLHNIKDLQETTVHNALHKIGDFQDEAAGVVEGILDFGRTRFRKGLRLTGLQDNTENAKAALASVPGTKSGSRLVKDQVKKKLEELKKSESDSQEKISSAESVESVWINPLEVDSPVDDGQEVLDKYAQRTISEQSKTSQMENLTIPSISTEEPSETDSPDPEYEDTADLASSIAKLRSLLQQRSSESNLSTPALSPMPDEYIQKQTESGNVSDVEALEVDGVMPSIYKFCTKTASGVLSNTLNTIKTALPGNNSGQIYTVERWKFKSQTKDSDTLIRMKKLLSERKEYCILDKEIDTAYDALDSVDIYQQSPVLISNLKFEDELDDFEGKVPLTKVLLDILCELLADTNSPLIQEPVVKGILLTSGSIIERKIEESIEEAMKYFADNLITIPETSNTNVLSMDLDEYIEALCSSLPNMLKYIFRPHTFTKAIRLFMTSLQKQKINQDVLLQVFELVVMKLIEESTVISPPVSA